MRKANLSKQLYGLFIFICVISLFLCFHRPPMQRRLPIWPVRGI